MMSKISLVVIMLLITAEMSFGQSRKLGGQVYGKSLSGDQEVLFGANVFWAGTSQGVTTDSLGRFTLSKPDNLDLLVVSFVGFRSDTLSVGDQDYLELTLSPDDQLGEVEVVYRQKTTMIDFASTSKVQLMDEREFLKAACCDLSESFETNPSVDVSFTDAVTGTREIQMLGLAGYYTQIMRENMPSVRGLSSIHGLTFIPGPWVESLQLNKGTGSVVNGYESIAGQINVNLRNPANMDKLYLNAYINQMGRQELNANLGLDVGEKWGTALLLHGKNNGFRIDNNDDGFLDNPLSQHLIAINRWELYNKDGLHLQFGAKGTLIDNTGGQNDFELSDRGSTDIWGMQMKTNRLEAWGKLGRVDLAKPYESFGLMVSGGIHDQQAFFGLRDYMATESFLYSNFIYQNIIGSTSHKYKTGLSFQMDDYQETLDQVNYDRTEIVPGAFLEYAYDDLERFSLVAGLRADFHNLFGTFTTPRLHLRYLLSENTVLRASAGRGLRTANLLIENIGIMASSRDFVIEGNNGNTPYGLDPEIAWNLGLNLTHEFMLDYRVGVLSFDLYRTDFENQVVVDRDSDPQQVRFYNLQGRSFSNSFQAQLDYELIKRLDVRLAYRWFDIQNTFGGQLMQQPLLSRHRAFLNLAYETRRYWKFDLTVNWQGRRRLPNTAANPEAFRIDAFSPDFALVNTQISKSWRDEKFEIYVGVENLLNFRQEEPILSSQDPFSEFFDGSMVWGPIFGRNTYVGLRYRIR